MMAGRAANVLIRILIALFCLFIWFCLALTGELKGYAGVFSKLLILSYGALIFLLVFWDKKPARFFRLFPTGVILTCFILLAGYALFAAPGGGV